MSGLYLAGGQAGISEDGPAASRHKLQTPTLDTSMESVGWGWVSGELQRAYDLVCLEI